MNIINVKRMKFIVENIYSTYHIRVLSELEQAGIPSESVEKYAEEIMMTVYRKAMEREVDSQEELENLAIPVINSELERILLPIYRGCKREYTETEEPAVDDTITKVVMDDGSAADDISVADDISAADDVSVMGDVSITDDGSAADDREPETLYPEQVEEEVVKPVVRRVVEPRISRTRINWALVIPLSILLTLVLWTVLGMLMSNDIIPRVNMGYTWFNSHVWNVF